MTPDLLNLPLKAIALTALMAGLLPATAQAATAPQPGKVFKAVSYTHLTLPTTPYV